MTEIKSNKRALTNEVMATKITEKAKGELRFGRFIPKMPLDRSVDYYTTFAPEISWQEALEKGKVGGMKKVSPGVDFQEVKIRKQTTETVTIGRIGGKIMIEQEAIERSPQELIRIVSEIGRTIGQGLETELVTEYVAKATDKGVTNLQNGGDYLDFIIESQGLFTEGNLNLLAVDRTDYTNIRKELKANNITVEPSEQIKGYFYLDNINVQGAATVDGGIQMTPKQVLGMDINNPPARSMYSYGPGVTTAILDDETKAWEPLVGYKVDDTMLKQDPPKYELFISARWGLYFENPFATFVGTLD